MDWGAEGLLEGLDGDERDARARLLDTLHDDGATTEELRAAVAEDRLVLVPIERALMAPAQYTLAELAERGGLTVQQTERRLRALGVTVPDDPEMQAFSDDDVEAAKRARTYIDSGMDADEARAVTHLLSGLMARAAGPVRQLFAETFLEAGDTEADVGQRYGEMAAMLRPLVAADLDYLLRMRLREYVRSDALGIAERTSGKLPDTFEVAVAFADIVGFTALGEELPSDELTGIAERLELLADEHVKSPARVVKTIGDAVMVVAREPADLISSMLDVMDAAEAADDLPSLRTGIAYGRAVARLGDWYGPAVNLAARLTARARPDSILVTNALRDALGDGASAYAFSEAGMKRFKGIADPVPVLRLRRSSGDSGPNGGPGS
jgi:adenylate cyclase